MWLCCHCIVAKSNPTLCNPIDCSPLGSSVHGFPRQEYWSGLPFPSPGDLLNPGIELTSPVLAGGFFATEPPERLDSSPHSWGKAQVEACLPLYHSANQRLMLLWHMQMYVFHYHHICISNDFKIIQDSCPKCKEI